MRLAQVWQENNSIGQQLQPPKVLAEDRKAAVFAPRTVAASNSQ